MREQLQHSARDQIDRRFVTGDKQQEHHCKNLVLGQSIVAFPRMKESTGKIVFWVRPSLFEKATQIAVEHPDRGDDSPVTVELVNRDDHVRPSMKLVTIATG